MDSTVAVALIAVGGTVASSGLGYFGSRHNTKVQLQAAEKSTETQLQSILLEVKQLDETQAKELRSARQRLYQDYLSSAYALRDFYAGASSADDEDAFLAAGKEFLRREIEIELLASETVKKLAADLYDLLTGALDKKLESSDVTENVSTADLLTAVYDKDQWRPVRDDLIDAMRDELTPAES